MIKGLIELLNTSEYYGVSERVDIAKGKYALPNNWKDSLAKIKRHSKRKTEPITWTIVWNKIKTKWQTKR
jgi:hypothetical protein